MSTDRERESHTVCWLPWLPLARPVVIGDVAFHPFGPRLPLAGCGDKLQSELLGLMQRFVNVHGDPIDRLTIALWSGDRGLPQVGADRFRRILDATDLLMLACYANNRYFSHDQYVNAKLFEVIGQNFEEGGQYTAIVTRRRDGSHSDLGYRRDEIRSQIPRSVQSCRSLELPCDAFVAALGQVYSRAEAHHEKIANSLSFFSLANTDELSASLDVEAVQLEWCIEHLLGPCDNRNDYASGVERAVLPYLSITARESSRPDRSKAANTAEQDWFILKQWALEHYLLRNEITHGGHWASEQWRWDISEHCLFATFLYPLLVKVLLAGHSEYALTDDDRAHLYATDKLLAKDNWRKEWGLVITGEGIERRIIEGLRTGAPPRSSR